MSARSTSSPPSSPRRASLLYDLIREPGESGNLGLDAPPALEDFRRGLSDYLEESRAYRAFDPGDAVIEDDAIRDRLEALGYITSP